MVYSYLQVSGWRHIRLFLLRVRSVVRPSVWCVHQGPACGLLVVVVAIGAGRLQRLPFASVRTIGVQCLVSWRLQDINNQHVQESENKNMLLISLKCYCYVSSTITIILPNILSILSIPLLTAVAPRAPSVKRQTRGRPPPGGCALR